MSLVYVGDSTFVDKEPLSDDELERVLPHDWSPKLAGIKVYPWIKFTSLERAYYGLQIRKAGPKSKVIESVDVATQTMEVIAPINDFNDALKNLQEGHKYAFEEVPFVEISTVDDYNRVLSHAAGEDDPSPHDWSPKKREPDSNWKGPGVYDLRDKPPTRSYKSVEAYERQAMEDNADQILDYMFQGEEWEEKLGKLINNYRDGQAE